MGLTLFHGKDILNQRMQRQPLQPLPLLLDFVLSSTRRPSTDSDVDGRLAPRDFDVTRFAEPREVRVDDLLLYGGRVAQLVPALRAAVADDELGEQR
jgi:hypothetical protein